MLKDGLVGVVTTPTIIPHSHKTTHVASHSDNGYCTVVWYLLTSSHC